MKGCFRVPVSSRARLQNPRRQPRSRFMHRSILPSPFVGPHETMRILSLRLIVALIIGVTLVSIASSWYEVQSQKDSLHSDLERKAEILGESLARTAELYLETGDRPGLEQMVGRFSNRDHLLGIGVYGRDGSALVVTPGLSPVLPGTSQPLSEASRVSGKQIHPAAVQRGLRIERPTACREQERYRRNRHGVRHRVHPQRDFPHLERSLYPHSDPGAGDCRNHDPDCALEPYRADRARGAVDEGSCGRACTPFDLAQRILTSCCRLAREVAPLAESMRRARAAAETEARLRNANESEWTAQRLADHVRTRLDGSSLFVVSNREPYVHTWRDNAITVLVPASGLVAAIEPILCACNGTWVAHGSGDADTETVDSHDRLHVPPEDPRYTLRRVWLSAEEEEGYYYGFANEGLWPLCHIAHTRPIFRASDWEHYYNVNQKFAEALVEEMAGEEHPVVLIQDYHFALLPRMVKDRLPHARIAIFWHIPWPNPESFEICPWQRELLDGLLGADLIGFHVRAHCNNFLNTVDRVLEARVDWEHFSVKRNDHRSSVLPFPISVEFSGETPETPGEIDAAEERSALIRELGIEAAFLGVGVDRVDYTKGIIERFQAVESFLERYPSYQGKFTFIQLGAPTRSRIQAVCRLPG